MNKAILSLVAAVLVCAAGTTVMANDGSIASSTLSSMGLSGIQVMTDAQGLEVRGMGYSGGRSSYGNRRDNHKQEASKPWASASGKSWAAAELDGHGEDAGAGSHNQYAAEGKYEASGANFSEASASKTDVLRVDYSDGTFSIETKVHAIHVEAGGFSSAKAF
jgi:hypothetical protein